MGRYYVDEGMLADTQTALFFLIIWHILLTESKHRNSFIGC